MEKLSRLSPPSSSSFHSQFIPLDEMESSLVSYLYELHVLIEEEGVYLPTVIVLGDDCSLKSHLLESMGELRLGEGDRISSNMPFLVRYQHHEGGQHIQLEKKGHPITDAVL
ncbi:unnamed protein product [Lactuca saligna]|uniref:Uncharacterized protein n=1 Tax=Lactuca saligna TaxID=75948 RepID=A0AA35ZLC1_LACSI|nr:unnamed protein product [Lactuca saligna]